MIDVSRSVPKRRIDRRKSDPQRKENRRTSDLKTTLRIFRSDAVDSQSDERNEKDEEINIPIEISWSTSNTAGDQIGRLTDRSEREIFGRNRWSGFDVFVEKPFLLSYNIHSSIHHYPRSIAKKLPRKASRLTIDGWKRFSTRTHSSIGRRVTICNESCCTSAGKLFNSNFSQNVPTTFRISQT